MSFQMLIYIYQMLIYLPLGETPLTLEFFLGEPPLLPLVEQRQPRALQVEEGEGVVGAGGLLLLLVQPNTFFARFRASQPAATLHLQVLVDLEHGGGGAGADAQAEAGEGVEVGQDDDGLDGLGKRPGVLTCVCFPRLRSIGKQGLKRLQ